MTPLLPAGRAVARVVVVLALALLAVSGVATTASAHAQLVETSPADGATVGAVPLNARLTFTDPIDPQFVRLRLTGPDGVATTPEPVVKQGVVTVPLTDGGPGEYVLVYRVVSKDGHPVSGRVAFTVEGDPAAGGGTSAPATPSADATDGATPEPTVTASSAAPTTVAAAPASGASDTGSGLPLGYLAGLAGVVLVLGTAAWFAVARRGR